MLDFIARYLAYCDNCYAIGINKPFNIIRYWRMCRKERNNEKI